MPKAHLEFDLDLYAENEKFKRVINADKVYSLLHALEQFVRNKWKYEDLSEEKYAAYIEIRDKIAELRNEYDVEDD